MLNALKSLIVLTFLLILWGGVVRGTDSGLGCPDWPLCHGQWIPPFEKAVLIEYFHRLLASAVGFLTIGFCIGVWRRPELRVKIGKWCGIALFLLILQVLLGAVTVRMELPPHVVTTHLAVALLFLADLFYMQLLLTKGGDKAGIPRSFWYHWAHTALLLLFLQILLGGVVASSQAGLACPDFPTCQGKWWPGLAGSVGIHFLHRIGALVVITMSLVSAIKQWPCPKARNLFLLGCTQILLGVGNVFMGLPLWMRLAHLGVAVLLFLGLMDAVYVFRREPSTLHPAD